MFISLQKLVSSPVWVHFKIVLFTCCIQKVSLVELESLTRYSPGCIQTGNSSIMGKRYWHLNMPPKMKNRKTKLLSDKGKNKAIHVYFINENFSDILHYLRIFSVIMDWNNRFSTPDRTSDTIIYLPDNLKIHRTCLVIL